MYHGLEIYYNISEKILLQPYGFHSLICEFVQYFQNKEGVNIINTNIFSYGGNEYDVDPCNILVFNKFKNSYTLITFVDCQCQLTSFLNWRDNSNDKLVCAQLQMTDVLSKPHKYKIIPNTYSVSDQFIIYDDPIDSLYEKRSSKKHFNNKLLFRGNCSLIGCDRRPILMLSGMPDFVGWHGTSEYWNELIECSIGLSVPGIGELCMRDIEYMAIGIPMLRFKYIGETLNPSLVPNYHYISIDRMDNHPDIERTGGNNPAEYALVYWNKFNEIKKDLDFLEYNSKNARKYYEDYLHPSTRLTHFLKITELD